MGVRRRHVRRSFEHPNDPITVRVSSRQNSQRCHEVNLTSARDGGRFARLVDDQVTAHPKDPLIISINGHQPWLRDVLSTCFEDYWEHISGLNRELQFAGTARFPEKASKRGKHVPWTFIMDQINVPQVYAWSVDMEPPESDNDYGLPQGKRCRMRVGVWFCASNACKFDRQVSTTLIFTQPGPVSEEVVGRCLFDFLYRDEDFEQPRQDEEGICWTFSRLYWLLTDWQNIIREISNRLNEAEINSHSRIYPVRLRTRAMHREVAWIFELKEYLHFHRRSLKKLQKLQSAVPDNEKYDPLWNDMNDSIEDLEQYDATMDSLKERFNNLLDLEFNIQQADQSDDAGFLTTVATLFLPVSLLSGLWGISTSDWTVVQFAYASIPVLVASTAFLLIGPWALRRWQKRVYPHEQRRIFRDSRDFTLLGNELPDNVDVPGGNRLDRAGNRGEKAVDASLHSTAQSSRPWSRTGSRKHLRL